MKTPIKNGTELTEELIARLDAGLYEPTDEDHPDMKALLQTYACLQEAMIKNPMPTFFQRLKHSLQGEAIPKRASWRQWLSWLREHWQPMLSATTLVALTALLVAQLFPNRRAAETIYLAADPANTSTGAFTYDYDPTGNRLLSRTDANGYTTHYQYDALGRLTKATDPLGRVVSYTYDANGRLLSMKEPLDVTIAYNSLAKIGHLQGDATDRMIVQQASFSIVVQDTSASLARLQEIVAERQGILASVETGHTAQGSLQTVVSLRVPADVLDDTLAQIKHLGISVPSERITNQDVTTSYVDLDARLHNLELTETELESLLKTAQQRGDTAEGILSIYDSLSNVRGQIEQLRTQKDLLTESVAMAQIDVVLVPKEIAPGFYPMQVLKDAWVQFLLVLQWIVTGLIWALVFAPLALVLSGVGMIIWRVWLKRLVQRDKEIARLEEDSHA